MELEKQVCNLENAKRLEELKVPQDSLFYHIYRWNAVHQERKAWFIHTNKELEEWVDSAEGTMRIQIKHTVEEKYSAFTVAELFDIIFSIKASVWLYPNAGGYFIKADVLSPAFLEDAGNQYNEYSKGENTADGLASLLIWLIENNYISFKA